MPKPATAPNCVTEKHKLEECEAHGVYCLTCAMPGDPPNTCPQCWFELTFEEDE